MDNIEKRVRYYLGSLYDKNNVSVSYNDIISDTEYFPPNILKGITLRNILLHCNHQHDNFRLYGPPIINIAGKDIYFNKYIDKILLFRWGDQTEIVDGDNMFYITKARKCDSKNGVILKLSNNRHWLPINNVKSMDIPFESKKNILIWRGATTGEFHHSHFNDNRLLAVKQCHNNKNCDVGFTTFCQGIKEYHYPQFKKQMMSVDKILKYKYLLSLEGNDVASGLKWQLYSNSVVFMRKPTCVSWAMEDTLEPYVHYIPLKDDFSDVDQQITWANNNQEKCKEIINNANNFIEQFLDERKEAIIENLVLKKYLDTVTINDN
uniref:Glycosyl transferase CAP10 domain-containing protein n=1 Tax=viral metagenome TaxID=1070528 RepID=A0A6C0CSC6_9ZZZZ